MTANVYSDIEHYYVNYTKSQPKNVASILSTQNPVADGRVNLAALRYSQTAAITSLVIRVASNSIAVGSSLSLYKIKKA